MKSKRNPKIEKIVRDIEEKIKKRNERLDALEMALSGSNNPKAEKSFSMIKDKCRESSEKFEDLKTSLKIRGFIDQSV